LNAELEAKLAEEAKQKRNSEALNAELVAQLAEEVKQKGNLEAQNAELVVGLAEQTAQREQAETRQAEFKVALAEETRRKCQAEQLMSKASCEKMQTIAAQVLIVDVFAAFAPPPLADNRERICAIRPKELKYCLSSGVLTLIIKNILDRPVVYGLRPDVVARGLKLTSVSGFVEAGKSVQVPVILEPTGLEMVACENDRFKIPVYVARTMEQPNSRDVRGLVWDPEELRLRSRELLDVEVVMLPLKFL
jgi:hypothetical protein